MRKLVYALLCLLLGATAMGCTHTEQPRVDIDTSAAIETEQIHIPIVIEDSMDQAIYDSIAAILSTINLEEDIARGDSTKQIIAGDEIVTLRIKPASVNLESLHAKGVIAWYSALVDTMVWTKQDIANLITPRKIVDCYICGPHSEKAYGAERDLDTLVNGVWLHYLTGWGPDTPRKTDK